MGSAAWAHWEESFLLLFMDHALPGNFKLGEWGFVDLLLLEHPKQVAAGTQLRAEMQRTG